MCTRQLAFATSLFTLMAASNIAAAQEPLTIKLSNTFPENHFLWTQGGKPFMDAVIDATNGRVRFEAFHAGQLGKDQLTVLSSGIAEMAVIAVPYAPDKLPLSGVSELPGFFSTSCEGAAKVWPLAKPGGALDQAEYEKLGLKVLFVAVPPPYKVMTAKAEVTSLDAISGLKIRAVGGAQAETVRALGGIPVQVQASEFYDSLSRGTVDGAIYAFVGMPPYSLDQVLHHSVEGIHAGSLTVLFAVSAKAWEGMPEDIRRAMTDAAAKAQEHTCQYQDADETRLRDSYVADKNFKVATLSADEVKLWNEKLAKVAENWAKKLDEQGRPGSEILKAFEATK